MSDQYYRFFPGDYLRDTGDLTLIEHGAYMILLHHYYTQEFLPSDKQKLYRICRAFTEEEKQSIDSVVARYFTENGNGHIINRKAEREIAGRKTYFDEQARKSKLGVEARRRTQGIDNSQPTGQPTGQLGVNPKVNPPSPSPSLKNKPSCSSNDELFDIFWLNYPRKICKEAARKAWKKIKAPTEVLEKIKSVLPRQKRSEQWNKENGQYIPYPSTYLNRGQWEDETIE